MTGRKFTKLSSAFAAALLATTAAFAADIKPAVVYDLGGKFDKSFNEGVFNGATKFKKDSGVDFRDLEIQSDAQREQVLRKFAKDGFSPIRVAIDMTRMLRATFTGSVGAMESVITSSFNFEPAIRATAPPESTPWVI